MGPISHYGNRLARLAKITQDEIGKYGDNYQGYRSYNPVGAKPLHALAARYFGLGLSLALHSCVTLGSFLGGKSLGLLGSWLRFSRLLVGRLPLLGLLRSLLL
jgi:hypothetical protein